MIKRKNGNAVRPSGNAFVTIVQPEDHVHLEDQREVLNLLQMKMQGDHVHPGDHVHQDHLLLSNVEMRQQSASRPLEMIKRKNGNAVRPSGNAFVTIAQPEDHVHLENQRGGLNLLQMKMQGDHVHPGDHVHQDHLFLSNVEMIE